MAIEPISMTALRRLPLYLQYMREMRGEGNNYVSATVMAQALGVHHTQVRQDLDSVGVTGIPKKGHPLEKAIFAIENFLGWNNQSSAFLIGAGNLGKALVGYKHFESVGIKVLAAFDNDGRKTGTKICGIDVLPVAKFVDLVKRMHINIAILAVPPSAVEDISERIIESGIKAVWNFIPVTLKLPNDIIVENVNLFSGFAVLSHKLKNLLEHKELTNDNISTDKRKYTAV
jgi:redox-sensing transcriptional repressor